MAGAAGEVEPSVECARVPLRVSTSEGAVLSDLNHTVAFWSENFYFGLRTALGTQGASWRCRHLLVALGHSQQHTTRNWVGGTQRVLFVTKPSPKPMVPVPRRWPAAWPRPGVSRRTDFAPTLVRMKFSSRERREVRVQRAERFQRLEQVQSSLPGYAMFLSGYRLYKPALLHIVHEAARSAHDRLPEKNHEMAIASNLVKPAASSMSAGRAPGKKLRLSGLEDTYQDTNYTVSPTAVPQAAAHALESDWYCIGPADVSGDSLMKRTMILFQNARLHTHGDGRVLTPHEPDSKRSSRSLFDSNDTNAEKSASSRASSARSVVIWWLFAAAFEMQFRRETVGLALHFFDSIRLRVPLQIWLEYAAGCLLIAGKVQERYPVPDGIESVACLLESLLDDKLAERVLTRPDERGRDQMQVTGLVEYQSAANCISMHAGATCDKTPPRAMSQIEAAQRGLFRSLLLSYDLDAWKCFSTLTPLCQGSWKDALGKKLPPRPKTTESREASALSKRAAEGSPTSTKLSTGWRRIMRLEPQILDWLRWNLNCPTIYNCLYALYYLEQSVVPKTAAGRRKCVGTGSRAEPSRVTTPSEIVTTTFESINSNDPDTLVAALSNATPNRPGSRRSPDAVETPASLTQLGSESPASSSCVAPRTLPLLWAERLADRCLHDAGIFRFTVDVIASACLIEALIESGSVDRARALLSFVVQRLSVCPEALCGCRRQLRDKCIDSSLQYDRSPRSMCAARDTNSSTVAASPRSTFPTPLQETGAVLEPKCPPVKPDCKNNIQLRMFAHHSMRQRWDNLLFRESLDALGRDALFRLKTSVNVSPVDIAQGRFG